jgi:flagellar hook-associated protein 3
MMSAIQCQEAKLARLQDQIASGAKINRPSDDPPDAWQVMTLDDALRGLATFTKNLNMATTNLEQTSSVMGEMSTQLVKAKQLLTQGASDTYGLTGRQPIADEIDSILEQLVSLANTQSQKGALFGGASSADAYAVTRQYGKITAVTYQGAQQALPVAVSAGVDMADTLVGSSVFQSAQRQAPVFLGNTGAKASAGTSNVTGDVWLTVTHLQTTYQDTSSAGVAAGAGSAAGDTIVGTAHHLTIDADAKIVRLDDGAGVSYAAPGDNMALTNAAGDKVFVDMTHIDPALTGTVQMDISATADVSIDDGVSSTTITTFPADLAVTDSNTGKILRINAAGMARAGLEPVRVPGTYDLFQTLIDARDLLSNTQGVPAAMQSQMLTQAVNSLDEVTADVTDRAAGVGSRLQALDALKTSLDNATTATQQQQSSLKDVDVTVVAADLVRTQVLYQMALAFTTKVLGLSLLDYMK